MDCMTLSERSEALLGTLLGTLLGGPWAFDGLGLVDQEGVARRRRGVLLTLPCATPGC